MSEEKSLLERAEAAVEHVATEVKDEVVHVGHEISQEFKALVADVKGKDTQIDADVKTDVKKIEEVFEHTPAAATIAGNTAASLAPKATVEGTPEVIVATPVPAKIVKNIPAPQTMAANGKSRYKADGLTIDWFDTHPKK